MPTHPDNTIIVNNPAWAPIIEQALRQGNARNLPRPEGYENERGWGTGYSLQRYRRADGAISCKLWFYRANGSNIHIGNFVDHNAAPCEHRARILQPGETTAGRVINLACGRQVRVEIDARGLPYPVPVELR